MATFKQTLIFEGAGHGWTENLYFHHDTDDLNAAMIQVGQVKNKRAALLGKQFHIKGERVALIVNQAGQPVTNKSLLRKFYIPGDPNENGEDTGTSLQVQFVNSAQTDKKLLFLGGPWAGVFPFANAYVEKYKNWQTLFQSWAAAVITAKMGWLARGVSQEAKITDYDFFPGTGHTTFVLGGAGITWAAGNPPTRVAVEFPTRRHPLDGTYLVVPSQPLQCTTAAPRPAPPFTVEGTMRLYSYNLVRMDVTTGQRTGTITGQNPVGRKRGRPLLSSRGRAPVTVRW